MVKLPCTMSWTECNATLSMAGWFNELHFSHQLLIYFTSEKNYDEESLIEHNPVYVTRNNANRQSLYGFLYRRHRPMDVMYSIFVGISFFPSFLVGATKYYRVIWLNHVAINKRIAEGIVHPENQRT